MKKLSSEYWETFLTEDNDGKKIGNGEEFEQLVHCLLSIMYEKKWNHTKKSHDNNRDFWIHLEEQHIWVECKNYKDTIAMNILAPTLVMAQIYDVNEIIFFSRSDINRFAKDKIMAFGEKSHKTILFYDGVSLEQLIWSYRSKLPEKYKPLDFINETDIDSQNPASIHAYFSGKAISNIHTVTEEFQKYDTIETLYYNETFALTFCLMNYFQEEQVEVCIEFADESEERFSFQYFYPTIVPERKQWYHAYLKKGEGRAISLNMRLIHYKAQIHLPMFHISFIGSESGKRFDWYSEKIFVESKWVGTTRLIGSNYFRVLDETKKQLVGNPFLSCMVLTGSSGTGKTRLLSECENIFLKNGYRIISLSGQENFSSKYLLKEIISFIYEIPSNEILDSLEERLFSDNSIIVDRKHTDAEKAVYLLKQFSYASDEVSLRELLDKYAITLYEKLSKNKIVLMIDNMQYLGSSFQHFIEHYIYYSVNQQLANKTVLLLVFNLDYMTFASSELLYNILHSNIRHLVSFQLKGFTEDGHGVTFLQELTRTNKDMYVEYFFEIIRKVSLKPYNLLQTVRFLEESNVIKILPNMKGCVISNLDTYRVLSDISNGIVDVLKKRFDFISTHISIERLWFICSIMYIFDSIDAHIQKIFQISFDELEYLRQKSVFQLRHQKIYIFDHDIIRDFFAKTHAPHILDCLKWLQQQKNEKNICIYRIAYYLYKISIERNVDFIMNICEQLSDIYIPERISSLFYNNLLNAFTEILKDENFNGIYIKYIHKICTYIRQYDGSEKAWNDSKKMYYVIQVYHPNALSDDIKHFRPFIHFCCDIAVQSHYYEEQIIFIKDVLTECKKANPKTIHNQDELFVLQAIMYNRWYLAYNTQSYNKNIIELRYNLMKKSRKYVDKIKDKKKKGLIEYLNNSDEGYNFYGFYKDKEKLFSIWDQCLIDIPTLVPEKTLNYYRKTVQYGLINHDKKLIENEICKAMDYLENGEFSHEPIIFRTFFLMAEVMSNLQQSPEKTYYYNSRIIDNILKMQQLLNNHKIGDILMLKGVNAHYAGCNEEVYYAFKEAYKYYDRGETSRYWIKKKLLEENIKYSFTVLGIYKMGYDVSCFPVECRQPTILFNGDEFVASGIQRTGDLHLNLPLI